MPLINLQVGGEGGAGGAAEPDTRSKTRAATFGTFV